VELMKVQITGTSPLMMHSDKFANPLLPETRAHKELTAKRKKTDDDHVAIARSEFLSSIYYSKDVGLYVPGANFDATFKAGAKLSKLGVAWTRGALVLTDRAKLMHGGPATPDALWEDSTYVDCRGVRVGTAKVMRYRPVFSRWACEVEIAFNPDVLNANEVRRTLSDAGALIGVCEYRPRFGRFTVAFS
jgi:hypothetical protein